MKQNKLILPFPLFLVLFSQLTWSQTETISTITDPQGWIPTNVRDDSSVTITPIQARPGQVSSIGDSSIEFETIFATPGQDKADYQFIWQVSMAAIDFPNRTLNNLTQLSYEYYRDNSSAVSVILHPPLRLAWLHDSNTPGDPTDDTYGFFIYEAVYQPTFGGAVATDTWVSENIFASEFWVFCSDCDTSAAVVSGVVQNFDLTFSDWLSAQQSGIAGDPTPPDFSTGNTYIVGINTGVGSGWGADLLMYVDNIRIAFGAADDSLFNFEDDVSAFATPTPVPTLNYFGVGLMILLVWLYTFSKTKTKYLKPLHNLIIMYN